MKFDKKAIRNTEICRKTSPKKEANFNKNKPKNKQPASLQKNRKSIKKKQAQIHRKTARLATLFLAKYNGSIGKWSLAHHMARAWANVSQQWVLHHNVIIAAGLYCPKRNTGEQLQCIHAFCDFWADLSSCALAQQSVARTKNFSTRACPASRAVGTAPRTPRPGGAPARSRGPASVAILLLFYFFNFENYNLYFHDQMPRAAGWNRGGGHQLNHPRHFVLYQGLL